MHIRAGHNHIYTLHIRYFWQGDHHMYGAYVRFWPTLHMHRAGHNRTCPPYTTRTCPPYITRTCTPYTTHTCPPCTTRTCTPYTYTVYNSYVSTVYNRTCPPYTTHTCPPYTTRTCTPYTTVHVHRIQLIHVVIPLPEYRIYTVYIWFWPTLQIRHNDVHDGDEA